MDNTGYRTLDFNKDQQFFIKFFDILKNKCRYFTLDQNLHF